VGVVVGRTDGVAEGLSVDELAEDAVAGAGAGLGALSAPAAEQPASTRRASVAASAGAPPRPTRIAVETRSARQGQWWRTARLPHRCRQHLGEVILRLGWYRLGHSGCPSRRHARELRWSDTLNTAVSYQDAHNVRDPSEAEQIMWGMLQATMAST
jgi:hypothetical protein